MFGLGFLMGYFLGGAMGSGLFIIYLLKVARRQGNEPIL